MAKWGEGDPRWIVEERPDAVNVNNWHWTEKNASAWSKEKLEQLLIGLKIDDPAVGIVEIDSIKAIDGEAIANNRKAKLIFFYEWVIKGTWIGIQNGKNKNDPVKGTFEIPNLSEENDPKDIDVSVDIDEESKCSDNYLMKELFRIKATNEIQKRIETYVKELKEEYAKDLILPTKEAKKPDVVKSVTKINYKATNVTEAKKDEPLKFRSLEMQTTMKCTVDEFYRVLTTEELVSAFTCTKAVVDARVGGELVMFDGNISGKFLKLEPNKSIKLNWRSKSWPENHYSEVTFTLEDKEDCTLVKLKQINVPQSDFERTYNGWNNHYFNRIKSAFCYGTNQFL